MQTRLGGQLDVSFGPLFDVGTDEGVIVRDNLNRTHHQPGVGVLREKVKTYVLLLLT